MAKKEKNITLYKTPFSKAYWRDACAELKSIRMLMIAALLIAMRVALKGVAIPLGPTLKINTAIYVTGLGSMIFGPVIAVLGAMISDTLGCFLFPSGPYFFPFIFVEIAGSLIYALFFYRARISTTRVFLARFCICLFVNVIMNSMILEWFNQFFYGKSYTWMLLPTIAKNLCMFPLETIVMTLFLKAILPAARKFGVVHDSGTNLKMTRKHIALLVVLFAIGVTSVGGYMIYDYNTRNQAKELSVQDRTTLNENITVLVEEKTDLAENQFVVIYKVDKELFGDTKVTYYVYQGDGTVDVSQFAGSYNGGISSKIRSNNLTKIATGTCTLVSDDINQITDFYYKPVE